jgi:addiction module HigA family antidote
MSIARKGPAGFCVHPGEILKEEFMAPLSLSGYALAKALGVPAQSVNDIVLKKRGISAEMAVRLARYFSTSAELWMNLQSSYELATAHKKLKARVEKITPLGEGRIA